MSDVEKLFYAVQAKTGGNFQWSDLNPIDQMQFVEAINIILRLTQGRH